MGHIQEQTVDSSNIPKTSQEIKEAEAASSWASMYAKDRYARDRVMKSARLLLPFLKEGDTILDVGCFTMEAKKYLPSDIKYIGIDQKAYHKETRVVDLNHGFEPIPCSHALCLETLEHLTNPSLALKSLSESLSENGRLVVSLPNEATIFHRLRALCGVLDAECFSSSGKHLHLPSLKQSKMFLSQMYDIQSIHTYISPSACGSKQAYLGVFLSLIPDYIHQFLADKFSSLFARGFIFLLKKPTPDNNPSS